MDRFRAFTAFAKVIETGLLNETDFETIRERWEDVGPATWIGQT